MLGVVQPGAVQAVAATRNGRVGLLATPATVESGAYAQAIADADPFVELTSVACPDLAAIIEAGFPFDQHVVDTVREYCAPLRAAGVDTVVLGCTHYPLVRPMLQRMLGRGVNIIVSGDPLAHQVEHVLGARGLANPRTSGEGEYSFLCTGDGETFRDARHALPAAPARRRRAGRARGRAASSPREVADDRRAQRRTRAADGLRPTTIEPGFVRTATGSALISCGETRVICTASVQESVPRWLAGKGRGWLTAEYGMLPASTGDRKQRDVSKGRPDGRTRRDPAPDRPLAARRRRLRGARRAHDLRRLRRAAGGRRHALRLDHRRLRRARRSPAARCIDDGKLDAQPAHRQRRRRLVRRSSTACRCSTSTTRRTRRAEVDANVVMTGEGGLVEVQATAERTPLSRAHLDELLALAAERRSSGAARRPGRRRRLSRAPVRLLLATRNDHKLREFARLLPAVELEPLPDRPAEPGRGRRHASPPTR